MRPKVLRKRTDFVYKERKIATVVELSENKATCYRYTNGASPCSASSTILSSLKVMWRSASSSVQTPETKEA